MTSAELEIESARRVLAFAMERAGLCRRPMYYDRVDVGTQALRILIQAIALAPPPTPPVKRKVSTEEYFLDTADADRAAMELKHRSGQ